MWSAAPTAPQFSRGFDRGRASGRLVRREQVQETLSQRMESGGAQRVGKLALGGFRLHSNDRIEASACRRKPDEPRALVVWIRPQHEISEAFEIAQEIIHRLLGDAHSVGELAGPQALQRFEAKQPDVCAGQLLVSRSDDPAIDPVTHSLPRVPQEAADPRTSVASAVYLT
jgi:hypothetical protein